MKSILELKGREEGKDIYVIGAGPSCDFLPRKFFEGKVLVGVNKTYARYTCKYIVRKEHADVPATLKDCPNAILAVSNLNYGSAKSKLVDFDHKNLFVFKHKPNRGPIDLAAFDLPEHLVVSHSTLTSAVHFAYYLGAKNIILVGADHGTIDGRLTYKNYYEDLSRTPWTKWEQYQEWLKNLNADTIALKKKLVSLGVPVCSMNPFINFGLEGHKYVG